jgi:Mrp family chromosome partitioning ATPase
MSRSTPAPRSSLLELLEPFASTFATLWTGLLSGARPEEPLAIAFTACEHGDGTTTAATCAAISLALHGGRDVVLVETNAYRPGLAALLGIAPGPGLEEVRSGEAPLETALRSTDVPGLRVLPVGVPSATSVAPRSAEMAKVWERLGRASCHLVVDAPPVPGHPQSIPIVASLDAVVLILNARRTRKRHVKPVIAALENAGIPLLGTLLNRCTRELPTWLARPR